MKLLFKHPGVLGEGQQIINSPRRKQPRIFYTFPYFLTFLLKRYMMWRIEGGK